MTIHRLMGIVLTCVTMIFPAQLPAFTMFGNLRCHHNNDHRYYRVNPSTTSFVGYQDLYTYPYTYQLPWNPCFNYCTRCPKPCFARNVRGR